MNKFEELKALNNCAIVDKGNLMICTIEARKNNTRNGAEVVEARNKLNESVKKLEDKKDEFQVNYKDVADKVMEYYVSQSKQPKRFYQMVGIDIYNYYFATGVVCDCAKAEKSAINEACKHGNGVLLAVVPVSVDVARQNFCEALNNATINLLHASEYCGYKGIEIEAYHNLLTNDFACDEVLWSVIEQTVKNKDKTSEINL